MNYLIFSVKMNISTGVNGESSFEATLLERAPGCQVYGYDFSVKSVCFIHLSAMDLMADSTSIVWP